MEQMNAKLTALVAQAEARGWSRVRVVDLTPDEDAASDAGDALVRDGQDLWLLAQTDDDCVWGLPAADGDAIISNGLAAEDRALADEMVEAGAQIDDDSYVSMILVRL